MGALLVLDTCGDGLSMGLSLEDGRLLKARRSKGRQDQQLGPALDALLKRSGLKLKDLSGIAATRGPGRFTGARIGLAFAMILGRSLGKPAVGLSVLEALAHEAVPKVPDGATLLALYPAARGEWFWQLFSVKEGRADPQGSPGWSNAGDFPRPKDAHCFYKAAGGAAGAPGGPKTVVPQGPGEAAAGPALLNLKSLAALARERLASLSPVERDLSLTPLYLKPAKFELLGK